MTGRAIRYTAAFLGGAASMCATAQDAPLAAAVDGKRVFTPADFARYAPRTALDMLRQVPGFVIRQAEDGRGLGQATSNVLINGERPSGKASDALTIAARTSASSVIRIEILDAATLNIAGLSGQVANIVAKATRITGQYNYRPAISTGGAAPRLTRFDGSLSGVAGPAQYTIGISDNAFREVVNGPTVTRDATGTLIDRETTRSSDSGEQPKVTAQVAIDGPGSSVGNLNLSWYRLYFTHRERGVLIGPGLADRVRTELDHDHDRTFEVGGDYAFALGPGRLKLIALARDERDPVDQQIELSFADASGTGPDMGPGTGTTGDRYVATSTTRERIGRAEYGWGSPRSDWQVTAESAVNRLGNTGALFSRAATGVFAPVALPGADGRVQEQRYEAVATHGRTLSPRLSLRATVGVEHSTLEQVGAGGLSRAFWRPKGALNAAWKPNARLSVNAKLERVVGQLDFADFLASVDLRNSQASAGNPQLVPPQSWDAQVETVRDLGALGTTTLRVYGRAISDLVDTVPIGADGEASGNLPRAYEYGAEWKSTVVLDRLGWNGGRLDATLQLQGSRVDDPLNGLIRPISNNTQQLVELTLRRDVPRTDWAYGGTLSHERDARDYRLTQLTRLDQTPFASELFIERKNVRGLTLRATALNPFGSSYVRERTVYVDRRTGPVAFYERRDRRIGRTLALGISGKF